MGRKKLIAWLIQTQCSQSFFDCMTDPFPFAVISIQVICCAHAGRYWWRVERTLQCTMYTHGGDKWSHNIRHCWGASLVQSTDIQTALIDLYSAFVFEIAYTVEVVPVLIFMQHYIFGLKDSQKIPVSVATTVATMRRLNWLIHHRCINTTFYCCILTM